MTDEPFTLETLKKALDDLDKLGPIFLEMRANRRTIAAFVKLSEPPTLEQQIFGVQLVEHEFYPDNVASLKDSTGHWWLLYLETGKCVKLPKPAMLIDYTKL